MLVLIALMFVLLRFDHYIIPNDPCDVSFSIFPKVAEDHCHRFHAYRCMTYLPTWITWMVDLYGINVGEYGSAMDPIGFLKLQAAFPRQIHQDRVVQLSIRNEREELATLLEVVSCQADIMIWRPKIIHIIYIYDMYMQCICRYTDAFFIFVNCLCIDSIDLKNVVVSNRTSTLFWTCMHFEQHEHNEHRAMKNWIFICSMYCVCLFS